MHVFIGNLPRNLSSFELRRMVEREILPKGFGETAKHFVFRSERLKRSEYQVFDKLTPRGIVRHGRALIEPDLLARRVIERLNNSRYRGNPLTVREYVVRANNNDRRALNWRLQAWQRNERRRQDRRQPTVDPERPKSNDGL